MSVFSGFDADFVHSQRVAYWETYSSCDEYPEDFESFFSSAVSVLSAATGLRGVDSIFFG